MRRFLDAVAAACLLAACRGAGDIEAPSKASGPIVGVWVLDVDAMAAGSPPLIVADDDPARTAPVLIVGATSARVYGDGGPVEGRATVAPLDATRWMLATHTATGDEHRTIVTPTGPDRATFTRAPDGQPLPLRRLPGASPIP